MRYCIAAKRVPCDRRPDPQPMEVYDPWISMDINGDPWMSMKDPWIAMYVLESSMDIQVCPSMSFDIQLCPCMRVHQTTGERGVCTVPSSRLSEALQLKAVGRCDASQDHCVRSVKQDRTTYPINDLLEDDQILGYQ